jgi:transcriptional regulator with XRE-family HTH domain
MEEKELRAILAENIKKFRNRRGWSQSILSEKLDISANYLSSVETGKGWVSPLTLAKLAKILEIEVFELFKPPNITLTTQTELGDERIRRFAKDLALALDVHSSETANTIKTIVAKVCNEHLDNKSCPSSFNTTK